jgi:uncharacterized integral membrane protein
MHAPTMHPDSEFHRPFMLGGYRRFMSDSESMTPGEEAVLRAELDRRQSDDPLRGSRTSGFWIAVAALGLVFILLVIFIAQNTRDTTVSFLAWDGQVPVAVALLIASAAGLFLATVAGSLRILQLRRRVRRDRQ